MHIVDMLMFWGRTQPNRPALVQPEMVTTFGALADAIESISVRIDRLQLDTREPVAVSIANPSFFLAAAFALMRCGFPIALVNPPLMPHLRGAGIRNVLHDTEGQMVSGGRNIRFDMSWLPSATPPGTKSAYRERPTGTGKVTCFVSSPGELPKPFTQSIAGLSGGLGSPFGCANGHH